MVGGLLVALGAKTPRERKTDMGRERGEKERRGTTWGDCDLATRQPRAALPGRLIIISCIVAGQDTRLSPERSGFEVAEFWPAKSKPRPTCTERERDYNPNLFRVDNNALARLSLSLSPSRCLSLSLSISG
jgi:hypothetical protein